MENLKQPKYRNCPDLSSGPATRRINCWLLVLGCLLLTPCAEADSFRCGRKVVRSGDAQAALLSACGEPQRRDSAQEALWAGGNQKLVKVQRWYYKSSGRKLERVVLLYQGKIVAVRTGGR